MVWTDALVGFIFGFAVGYVLFHVIPKNRFRGI
jgi:uncharacterized membrane-anchored protein YhcB (DUF1043 family)